MFYSGSVSSIVVSVFIFFGCPLLSLSCFTRWMMSLLFNFLCFSLFDSNQRLQFFTPYLNILCAVGGVFQSPCNFLWNFLWPTPSCCLDWLLVHIWLPVFFLILLQSSLFVWTWYTYSMKTIVSFFYMILKVDIWGKYWDTLVHLFLGKVGGFPVLIYCCTCYVWKGHDLRSIEIIVFLTWFLLTLAWAGDMLAYSSMS